MGGRHGSTRCACAAGARPCALTTSTRPRLGRSLARWWWLLAFASALAHGQGLGLATWNVGWLLDEATHARWATTCAKFGWPQDASALSADARAALAGLPYCNVHNGMMFPPDYCRSRRNGWPKAARYPAQHPCRDTADLATWPAYQQKIAALRAMFARLERDGVQVVALQEVTNAAAVAQIVPPGWRVTTTAELPGTPTIAQHVGVAWKTGTAVRAIDAVPALADSGLPDRPLRPGLAFTVDVGRHPVRVLVVHLKAGCRSREIDAPLTAAGCPAAAGPPGQHRLRLRDAALPVAGARSVDRCAGREGLCRRGRLQPHAAARTRHSTATAIASASTARARSIRSDRARCVARAAAPSCKCPATVRAMFPELNDDRPKGSVLWRARFPDLGPRGSIPKDTSGDCRLVGPHGELAHDGIDHILISDALKRRLSADALTMRVRNYVNEAGSAASGRCDHRAAVRSLSAHR